jgi:hypothetical protein
MSLPEGEEHAFTRIAQNRRVGDSLRLDKATAIQPDDYAAFVHATANDVVDKNFNSVSSKGRDFGMS